MSEEFGGRLPTEIMAERARLPVGFLEQIIEYRAYAATKAAYDRHTYPKDKGPLWRLVDTISLELQKDEHDRIVAAQGQT